MVASRNVKANGDEDGEAKVFRLSISLDPSLRRKLRLAAAIADKTVGEYCAEILERAADKAGELVRK